MHPVIEGILARPVSHRIGVLAGSLVLVGAVFWFGFYSSQMEELAKAQEKIEDLETKITSERRLAMNLKQFREEVKELDIKLKIALQELPDAREIPELLESVSNLARDSGLEVALFKTKPENMRDFYAEVPVEVQVAGTFHQITTFFDEVGHLSRIVNINNMDLRDPKIKDNEDLVQVTAGCNTVTYRYLDESERVQSQEKKGGKKRKK